MNHDIKKATNEALAALERELASGKSEALTRYLAAMGRFTNYSLGNQLLILHQCPTASRVAGFHAWRKLDRFVRKGQKGIAIMAPLVCKSRDRGSASGDNASDSNDQPHVIRGFRVAHVFDVSQTDGAPLPALERVHGDTGPYLAKLKTLIASDGLTLTAEELPSGTEGYATKGRIVTRVGLEPAGEFAVLVHELAHHRLRHLDADHKRTRDVQELEAEAVAFVVCSAIGLQTGSASADYVKLYGGNAESLWASLERIRDTAVQILHALSADDDAALPQPPTIVTENIVAMAA